VAAFRFSRLAESDLTDIIRYTFTDGAKIRPSAISTVWKCVASNSAAIPPSAWTCDDIRPGLRRMEHGRHVVYRQEAGGVLISRILHQRMLPERWNIDFEDEGP
jgi:toxin ParE1/3/4